MILPHLPLSYCTNAYQRTHDIATHPVEPSKLVDLHWFIWPILIGLEKSHDRIKRWSDDLLSILDTEFIKHNNRVLFITCKLSRSISNLPKTFPLGINLRLWKIKTAKIQIVFRFKWYTFFLSSWFKINLNIINKWVRIRN